MNLNVVCCFGALLVSVREIAILHPHSLLSVLEMVRLAPFCWWFGDVETKTAGKWRVLFRRPDRKGNSSLLHVVAASHDRPGKSFGAGQGSDEDDDNDDNDEDTEPIVAMTCISLHTSGHGARSALASLQLR